MPRKLELNWHKGVKQWYRRIGGRQVYLGGGEGKGDMDGYARALEKYHSIDADSLPPTRQSATLASLADRYLAEAKRRATEHLISHTRAQSLASNLVRLQRIAGDLPIRDLSKIAVLRRIRDDVLRATTLDGQPMAATTIQGTWRDMLAMVRWGYDLEIIHELPRGLRTLGPIHIPRPVPKTVADGELLTLWNEANAMMRCWMLLGLNCGFTSIDLATLRPAHIIEHGWRIRRERHKTYVPTDHLLWPLTRHYLVNSGLTDTGWESQRGRQLVNDGTDGAWHCDAISRRWHRLCVKVEVTGKPFKLLRKTTAQILSNFGCPLPIIQQFLGHARATVAERHYYTPTAKTLLDPWLARVEPVFRFEVPPPCPPTDDPWADMREYMGSLWPGDPIEKG